jgi:GNAT superfamily N-acetyltransferase
MSTDNAVDIRRVTTVADVIAAEDLYDGVARVEWAQRFLAQSGHHLLVAYVDNRPVGMVSGVEMTHPDKGTEMFLYELAVEEEHQRQGIGKALVTELVQLAWRQGCYGMWVLTDRTNTAAMAVYQSAGGVDDGDSVVLVWTFSD